ncbi:MAG: ABC-2 family transporter protein [Chloroflexi bacterium]|nr:ABC-2 family transporter protein [Chloroflexota bacterium]
MILGHTMRLYFKLIGIRVRAQMQYRLSFWVDLAGTGLATGVEFLTLAAVFGRFGSIGGWSLGEVAFLYGLVETAFATMDMIFSGFDPDFFSQQVRRGTFDQMLLRPVSLPLQIFASEFLLRRIGRMAQGLAVWGFSLTLTHIAWTPAKLLYLPVVTVSTVAFFGGLFVAGAALCFYTVQSIEAVNIFTYGGTYMLSYPMHIYDEWFRRFFIYIVPSALLVYYPALFFLDKPDPLGLPSFAPFLAPLAGFGTLLAAFALWWVGVRRYTSTGT